MFYDGFRPGPLGEEITPPPSSHLNTGRAVSTTCSVYGSMYINVGVPVHYIIIYYSTLLYRYYCNLQSAIVSARVLHDSGAGLD